MSKNLQRVGFVSNFFWKLKRSWNIPLCKPISHVNPNIPGCVDVYFTLAAISLLNELVSQERIVVLDLFPALNKGEEGSGIGI